MKIGSCHQQIFFHHREIEPSLARNRAISLEKVREIKKVGGELSSHGFPMEIEPSPFYGK